MIYVLVITLANHKLHWQSSNQSKLVVNKCSRQKARTDVSKRVTIGFGFTSSDWLMKRRTVFQPIAESNQMLIIFDTQMKIGIGIPHPRLTLPISLRRRANARNISFRISLRRPIPIINSVDKTKLPYFLYCTTLFPAITKYGGLGTRQMRQRLTQILGITAIIQSNRCTGYIIFKFQVN